MDRSERKSLSLVSSSNINISKSKSQTTQKKRILSSSTSTKKRKLESGSNFTVFEDNGTPVTSEEITAVSRTESDLLTSEEPSIDYWKRIAEARRQALEKTLIENEELHNKVEELTIRVSELQAENDKYVEIAEKAEYLADTIQMLTGDQCDSGSVENTPADASEITPDDEPSAESFNYSKDNSDSLVYKIIPN